MQNFLAVPRAAITFDSHEAWFPRDHLTALVYLALASKANWCDSAAPLPRQKVALKRGQLVLAQRQFADDLGIGRQQLRRCLDNLEKSGKINPQTNQHGSIITICNYDSLFLPKQEDQPTIQPTPNPRPTHAQPNQDKDTKRQRDKKTEDSSAGGTPAAPEAPPMILEQQEQTKLPAKPKPKPDGVRVWESYREAYVTRYGKEPVRNGKVNAMCCQLVARLGVEQAVAVAGFYVRHNGRFYVEKLHMLDFCVKDAEKLNTESQLNAQMTTTRAQQVDQQASNAEAIASYFRAKHAGRAQ